MMNLKQTLQTGIPGWNGRLLAHMMAWYGEGNPVKVHRVSRYQSNDPAVVAAQLDTMRDCGIEGVIVTWQGPTVNPFLHDATIKIWEGCMERQMLFALLLDQWIAKGQPNPAQAVIAALQHIDTQRMLASPCYLPEQFILEFDLGASAGANIGSVQAVIPSPLLSWHTGFSWPSIPADAHNPVDSLAALKADNLKPTMRVPAVNVMFNDGGQAMPVGTTAISFRGIRNYAQSVWGGFPTRVIDHQAGNWFFDQLAVTPATAPYIAIATWNDHDEGTGIEHIAAVLSGKRIGK
jgi:hypothetical protein